MSLQVAIVGSGPAGCYAAEKLARDAPNCRIALLDRLPTPYGLVRFGVAPDHQGTKAITRVFDRVLERDGVSFLGNVEIGRDANLAELRDLFDAVVLANGAPADRRLGVPGEALPGVVGSGTFVGWYNGHPDFTGTAPDLSRARSAVVIGNGNVALDVARVLAKAPAEMERSDLAPEVEAALAAAPLAEIHIVGRRGPGETSFSVQELSELGALARAEPVIDPAVVEAADPVGNAAALDVLRGFAVRSPEGKPVAIRFHFHARPVEMQGENRVEAVRFARPDGSSLTLPADLVVTCIGYRSEGCGELAAENGVLANEDGRIAAGLYVCGWAKRGPSGTIATNRAEAHAVAQRLIAEVTPSGKPGVAGLVALLARRGVRTVDNAARKRIEAAETARAPESRVRRKFTRVAEMLEAGTEPASLPE